MNGPDFCIDGYDEDHSMTTEPTSEPGDNISNRYTLEPGLTRKQAARIVQFSQRDVDDAVAAALSARQDEYDAAAESEA